MCAVADAEGGVLTTEVIPTTTPETTIGAAVRFFEDHPPLAALGVGTFGPVDVRPGSPTYGHILATPKPGWANVDVVSPSAPRWTYPSAWTRTSTPRRWGNGGGERARGSARSCT
ncbi:hypothetical protein GCM10027612_15190 [Microbispora bryophytorum subsp. camponoti]